ncbi:MAG: hypothetical protein ACI90V_000572, partial [Bacillariaceae sp.]|jgi:hypothetical protein
VCRFLVTTDINTFDKNVMFESSRVASCTNQAIKLTHHLINAVLGGEEDIFRIYCSDNFKNRMNYSNQSDTQCLMGSQQQQKLYRPQNLCKKEKKYSATVTKSTSIDAGQLIN